METQHPDRCTNGQPRIVIVGAGFGGMTAAKALDSHQADIVLIDRANHHLFQPPSTKSRPPRSLRRTSRPRTGRCFVARTFVS